MALTDKEKRLGNRAFTGEVRKLIERGARIRQANAPNETADEALNFTLCACAEYMVTELFERLGKAQAAEAICRVIMYGADAAGIRLAFSITTTEPQPPQTDIDRRLLS
jgi:hypothetical protein